MKKLLLILTVITPVLGFTSITQMEQFAAQHQEFPQPDTSNVQDPNYESFYQSYNPGGFTSYIRSFLETVGILSPPAWTPDNLASLLTQLTSETPCITNNQVIKAKICNQFYLWGDLKGAFHSFTRDLTFLRNNGVIADDLTIHENVYFIFVGNVLGQSPYTVETLTAVLALLQKNPCKVLFLGGEQEAKDGWKDRSLAHELRTKAKGFTDEYIPLSGLISTFFASLPQSVFITSPDNKSIQLSYYGLGDKPVEAIIQGVDRSFSYQVTPGLQQLPAEKGATSWNIFSSPTLTSKKLYQFSHDAFVRISPAPTLATWKITLISKPITSDTFTERSFNLLTGQPLKDGEQLIATKEPIIFGTTLDLSKTSAPLGKRLREGLELRANKENWQGGINGHPLKLVFLDDQYTPRITQQLVKELRTMYGTNRIVAPLGTPTTASFIPLVEKKETLVLFPYTGAMIFRQPELTYMAHLRTSYANEAIALITYAYNNLQARRFAVFYQDDSYGRAPLEGAKKAFKDLGITDWLETPYGRNNPNIEGAAAKITTYNPDVILFFSTFAPSAALIRKLGINKVASMVFMGISFLTDVFRNFLRSKGLELIMARVMPDPRVPNLEIIRNYQEDMKNYNPTGMLSVDSLEGYLNVDVLIHILRSIEGPLTDKVIIEKIEQIKDLEYKGLTLNFNKQSRELLKDVWIDTGKGEWIKF